MPRCEGLPNGPCPGKRNDGSVKLGEGELMLCSSCDTERHQQWLATHQADKVVSRSSKSLNAKSSDAVHADNTPPTGRNGKSKQGRTTSTTTDNSGKSRAAPGAGSAESQHITSDANGATASSVSTTAALGEPQDTNVLPKDAGGDGTATVKCSELLMYVQHFRDRATPLKIQEVLLKFYHELEVSAAKTLLTDLFGTALSGNEFLTERRTSSLRSAKEAEVVDILNILEAVDRQDKLVQYKFVAVQYDRLPRYGPEESNLMTIIDKQARTEQLVSEISEKVDRLGQHSSSPANADASLLTEAVDRLNTDLRASTGHLQQQIDQLTAVCTRLAQSSSSPAQTSSSTSATQDRSLNVIVNGVDETRDNTWKSKVSNILSISAGREVSISDAFRIGRFVMGKKRPIIVKLQSVWDRRLVLSGARNLANFDEYRNAVFVRADESADVRRKKALDRLKGVAVRRGRVVDVTNGVLSVDGVAVYSIEQGRLGQFNIYDGSG